jgi:deoxyribose-phosphate aldolase
VPERLDPELALRLLSLLDLTSLGEDDSPQRIAALCAAALAAPVQPAAVCLYPEHVANAAALLAGSGIRLATVVNFPDGGNDPLRVVREIRRALAVGADEIDMVLPYHGMIDGDLSIAERVVRAGREACGPAVLKLILETGELASPDLIRRASQLGLECGVDFLKTSTGKVRVNASLESAAIMLDAIAEYGRRCGFKAAGGVREPADAARYLALADQRMGETWTTPRHFRIGASSLFDALCSAARGPAD